ncbi:MAG TPA: VOC family protein [Steroidobacteraceae bacterium]|nr:VOC family protein [Steroidobacteraceae bacterium]
MKNPLRKSQALHAEATLSRRQVLGGIGAAALLPWAPELLRAQAASAPASPPAAGSQLPLRTTGLEHMGTVVPDVAAAGKFYGRLFNPELYKEKEPPLRYYVTLGVGYLALGSRANQSHAFFDHFCALVENYDGPAMAEELKAAGLPAGKFGIIPDPDGIGLQLLSVPGGLAKSTEPAGRIVEGDALVRPLGLQEVVLHVPDVDKALAFYRKFFGREASRRAHAAWFQIAGTRLGIETAEASEAPRVHRIGIRVERFDRRHVSAELTKLGARIEKGAAKHNLRFRDPLGLGIELQPT